MTQTPLLVHNQKLRVGHKNERDSSRGASHNFPNGTHLDVTEEPHP